MPTGFEFDLVSILTDRNLTFQLVTTHVDFELKHLPQTILANQKRAIFGHCLDLMWLNMTVVSGDTFHKYIYWHQREEDALEFYWQSIQSMLLLLFIRNCIESLAFFLARKSTDTWFLVQITGWCSNTQYIDFEKNHANIRSIKFLKKSRNSRINYNLGSRQTSLLLWILISTSSAGSLYRLSRWTIKKTQLSIKQRIL